MAGGVGGFAEGFSSGLGQGMGIISQVRADKRADKMAALQEESMRHSMDLQDKQEGRAQAQFDDQMETSKWTKENFRPLQLEEMNQRLAKYKQDLEIGGVELATKNLMLGWLPEDHALQTEQTRTNIRLAKNQDHRAELSLADQLTNSSFNRGIAANQESRAQQEYLIRAGGAMLPMYTSLIQNNLPVPKVMQDIMSAGPFGMSQQLELAEASKSFPKIIESASKGDFSFMRDPDMAESANSLARPVAMRIARERGFDTMSARVVGMTPYKTGDGKLGMYMDIMARDPKTGEYRQFRHGVRADGLAHNMELSAHNGMALAAHPAYQQLQQAMPGYLSAMGVQNGSAAAQQAAGQNWDKQSQFYREVLKSDPENAEALNWIKSNGDRSDYINRVARGAIRTQNVRGDASPSDWNRVSSVVSRFTGQTDPGAVSETANKALKVMGRLGGTKLPDKNIPGIAKLVREEAQRTGKTFSDPAFSVQMFYMIQKDPALRKEMANALKNGGQGAGNPSGGGLSPKARPLKDARKVVSHLFPEAHITDWRRDPNSALGRKNPNSWHTRTGAAVDVRPIPGMSFERFIGRLEAANYKVIQAIDEVKHPSKHATGPHWHVVLGL